MNPKSEHYVSLRKKPWQFWLPDGVWIVREGENIRQRYVGEIVPSKELRKEFQATRGKVVKADAKAEFKPNKRVRGGYVTKVMPRQLREIKEGQEKDDSPRVW